MLSIRKGLALLLLMTLAFAAGCGGKKEETAPAAPKDPVKITFWHGMGLESSHGKATMALVDKFNASHKDIIVEASYQGSYGDLDKKITSAITAGTPPTIFQGTDAMMATYVKNKTLVELDKLIPANDLKDFPKALLDSLKFDGKQYALPYNKSVVLLIYDPDVVKTAPKTWADLWKTAQEVSIKDKRWGLAYEPNAYMFGNLYAQTGGAWLKDGKAAFAGAEGVEVLKQITEATKNGSAITTQPKTYATDYYNDGRASMIVTTSASLAYIKPTDANRKWATAMLPAGPKNDSVSIAGANLAIVQGAKEAEVKAAATFLTWLTGKDQNLEFATAKTGYGPLRKSAMTDPKWAAFVKENPAYDVVGKSMEKGNFMPSDARWPSVLNEITSAMEQVRLGKAEPKAALEAAAKKADELLSK